jgi:hypothetical protein
MDCTDTSKGRKEEGNQERSVSYTATKEYSGIAPTEDSKNKRKRNSGELEERRK